MQDAPVDHDDLAAVEQVLADWDDGGAVGTVTRLGGLTNRIFRVDVAWGAVTVRLPGPGTDAYIDRAAEMHNARIAADQGIGPDVLHAAAGGAMVCTFLRGRALSPEDVREVPDMVERVARILRRVHDAPTPFVSTFDAFAVITDHRAALDEVPGHVDALIERVARVDPPPRLVPCHNDPWPENFLDGGDRLHLLDWEYSAMGDPAWDLADVIVEARLDAEMTDRFLFAYSDGPTDRALRERVATMGPVTDLLWGLWALVQEQDGNAAMDFATYGRRRIRRAARSLRPVLDH